MAETREQWSVSNDIKERIYWRIGFGVEVVKRKDEYFSR